LTELIKKLKCGRFLEHSVYTNFQITPIMKIRQAVQRVECRKGAAGLGRLGVTRDHATYSILVETMRLSRTVFDIQQVICRKWPILTPTVFGAPDEFRWHDETRVAGVSCGVVCVIVHLAL